jgi:hypothetical protein
MRRERSFIVGMFHRFHYTVYMYIYVQSQYDVYVIYVRWSEWSIGASQARMVLSERCGAI